MRVRRAGGAASLPDTLGHDPSAIDFLALTHLHDDHVGWVAAFTGTRYVVGAVEWEASQGRTDHRAPADRGRC
jgi:glyoxylase-like metal-dependent hydrolase (beta-lactamase superfamily II)